MCKDQVDQWDPDEDLRAARSLGELVLSLSLCINNVASPQGALAGKASFLSLTVTLNRCSIPVNPLNLHDLPIRWALALVFAFLEAICKAQELNGFPNLHSS